MLNDFLEMYNFTNKRISSSTSDMRFAITLADGTSLPNLKLNGNCFISDENISDSIFEDNLDTITVSDGETDYIFTNILLLTNYISKLDGKTWFVLADKTQEQIEREQAEKERLTTEQYITDMDLNNIEMQQAITDIDIRLIALEVKENE